MLIHVPRAHGAWAMVVAPVVIGAAVAGPRLAHGALLVAALLGYMGVDACLEHLRRAQRPREPLVSAALLLGLAFAAGAWPLWIEPRLGLLLLGALPVAGLAAWAARARRERALLNGLLTILALSLGAPAAVWLARGLDRQALAAGLSAMAFFSGSLLFVRTHLRGRDDRRLLGVAIAVHVALVAVPAGLSAWWVAASFGPSLLRLLVLAGRRVKPLVLGITEILNTLAFVPLAVIACRTV